MFLWQRCLLNNVPKAGVAILGAAVVGGAATAYGAKKAADAQRDAAARAQDTQMQMYERTRADLAPYRELGTKYSKELDERMPFLTSPIEFTQEAIEATPGYKIQKRLGEKAVQNAAAKRGLGVSGAALRGAIEFNKDLNLTTYKDQFALENTNRTNAYNRLKGLVDTGQQAAGATGSAGQSAATGAANAIIGGGNAAAAGYNAMAGAVADTANSIGGYAAYKGMYGDDTVLDMQPREILRRTLSGDWRNSVDLMPRNI